MSHSNRVSWWDTAALVAWTVAGHASARAPTGLIIGRVTDEQGGEALTLARVEVVEAHRTELTREDGSFRFAQLLPERYTVTIQQLGYGRHVAEVEVGAAASITVALHVRAIELSEIVVTGALTRRAGADVMSPVSVMSGAELDRRMAATVSATLEAQPGLAVSSLGPVTGRAVLRGLGGDRILILEDGMWPGDMSSTSSDDAVAIEAAPAAEGSAVHAVPARALGPVQRGVRGRHQSLGARHRGGQGRVADTHRHAQS